MRYGSLSAPACTDVDRNLRLLGFGAGIRTLGAALYSPFLALFLVNGLGLGYLEVGVIFVGVGAVQAPFSLAGGLSPTGWAVGA